MRELKCISCEKTYPTTEVRFACDCGGLLDLTQPLTELDGSELKKEFDSRLSSHKALDRSGVWRFRELLFDPDTTVSRLEGDTRLYPAADIGQSLNITLYLKHEGENPTGSFKDRGMTTAITAGVAAGCDKFICASTGNTSASLASYCATAGKTGIVIIPEGKIAYGKLSQALAYGAKVLQIKGDFDAAMQLVTEIGEKFDQENTANSIYVLNSINPFRVEGQKTIIFELFQQLSWQAPDWIVLPGGNLGNTSAFGKAIAEAYELGLIDKKPRLAVVQATGANPFYTAYKNGFPDNIEPVEAETIATAVKIGNPKSYTRAMRAIKETDGVIVEVNDNEIMDAKATIDGAGIGCEPASACSLAGLRQLVADSTIKSGETVVGILTGHLLKDPDATINYHTGKLAGIDSKQANQPQPIDTNVEAVLAAMKNR